MSRTFAPRSTRRPLAALLACALVLVQLLGWLHLAVHGHGAPAAAHAGVVDLQERTALDGLFAQHHDASDCQLFDQLSHADTVAAAWVRAEGIRWAPPRACAPPRALRPVRIAAALARGPPRRG